VFFAEGTTVLFQVAIALIFIVKDVILYAKKPDDISSTLAVLKARKNHVVLWPFAHAPRISLTLPLIAIFSSGCVAVLLAASLSLARSHHRTPSTARAWPW
jgi:hypothetical protein